MQSTLRAWTEHIGCTTYRVRPSINPIETSIVTTYPSPRRRFQNRTSVRLKPMAKEKATMPAVAESMDVSYVRCVSCVYAFVGLRLANTRSAAAPTKNTAPTVNRIAEDGSGTWTAAVESWR